MCFYYVDCPFKIFNLNKASSYLALAFYRHREWVSHAKLVSFTILFWVMHCMLPYMHTCVSCCCVIWWVHAFLLYFDYTSYAVSAWTLKGPFSCVSVVWSGTHGSDWFLYSSLQISGKVTLRHNPRSDSFNVSCTVAFYSAYATLKGIFSHPALLLYPGTLPQWLCRSQKQTFYILNRPHCTQPMVWTQTAVHVI